MELDRSGSDYFGPWPCRLKLAPHRMRASAAKDHRMCPGAIVVTKPSKFTRLGDIPGPKPYKFVGFGVCVINTGATRSRVISSVRKKIGPFMFLGPSREVADVAPTLLQGLVAEGSYYGSRSIGAPIRGLTCPKPVDLLGFARFARIEAVQTNLIRLLRPTCEWQIVRTGSRALREGGPKQSNVEIRETGCPIKPERANWPERFVCKHRY